MKSESNPLLGAIHRIGKAELGAALDLLRLIWTIEHNLQVVSRALVERIGVTGPQLAVLRFVRLFPGVTSGELSHILQLHPSTLTQVFKKLVSTGLLERREDAADRRRALFFPTAKGEEIGAVDAGSVEAVLRRALTGMATEKISATEEVLEKFARELELEVGRMSAPALPRPPEDEGSP